jgi:hypothetical protein
MRTDPSRVPEHPQDSADDYGGAVWCGVRNDATNEEDEHWRELDSLCVEVPMVIRIASAHWGGAADDHRGENRRCRASRRRRDGGGRQLCREFRLRRCRCQNYLMSM